jgi:NAD(P)-dependent dehydrogenase (short-subunit alcohol dehydrogenase family)
MTWSLGAGLEDKGVVVTGAAGGIGRAVVAAFAATNARVAAIDLEQERVDEVVAGQADPGRHVALAADLRHLSSHEGLLERVVGAFGRLDVLAHVAAVIKREPDIDAVTEEQWALQEEINLRATFFLNRAAARIMLRQGRGGRIVNFASQGWWTGGYGGSVVYAATKGGVVSMTRGLARTYAPDGILVNCVAPGAVDTAMMRDGLSEAARERFLEQIPLGRMADPAELASAVVFLASQHATYITGATLNVSGGQLTY